MTANFDYVKLDSDFRIWCTTKWFEHRDEVFEWTGCFPEYSAKQFFNKYKWLLWREFKATKEEL